MIASAPLLALLLAASPPTLSLPHPFKEVRPENVMRALYPEWDQATRGLGATRPASGGARRPPENAELWEAEVWKEQGQDRLLALVSTWTYSPEPAGALPEERDPRYVKGLNGPRGDEALFCDVGVLEMVGGKLTAKALIRDAVRCSGSITASLVPAPQGADGPTAFGVRVEQSDPARAEVILHLFGPQRGTYRLLQRLTLEATVRGAWRRLRERLTAGQELQLRVTRSAPPTARLSDRRPVREAPLGVLVCRVGGSRPYVVGSWPSDEASEGELSLTIKAAHNGPLECLMNDDDPGSEGLYVDFPVD